MFLILLFIFMHSVKSNNILTSNFSKTERIYNCINKLTEQIIEEKTLIISATNETLVQNINTVIFKLNSCDLLNVFGKFDNYIFLLTNVEQLDTLLNQIYLLNCWNPYGKFSVSILNQENNTKAFEILWKYYVTNINLITYDNNTINVYTYFPYDTENCVANISPTFIFNCEKTTQKFIYPNKIPNDLKSCSIKVMALAVIPYVMDTKSFDNISVRKNGLEVFILNEIMKPLNISIDFIPNNYSHWGLKQPNGNFSNMLFHLQNRKIDMVMGIGPFIPDANEFEQLEQALLETVGWVVPTAEEYPEWTNLMHIYQIDVWMYLLFCVVANGVTWWIFGRKIEFVYSFKDISLCIINSIYIILFQGGIRTPNTGAVRILLVFWCIFSLVMYSVHQSKLVSFLTKPKLKHQITTSKELAESNLLIGMYPPSVEAFKTNPYRDRFISNIIPCSINEECVNRTAFKRDMATLKNRRQLMFLMKRYYTHPDGRPMLYTFKDGIFMIPKFNVVKGYPLSRKFNKIIMQLAASGLIAKWDAEIMGKKKIPLQNKKRTALSLKHLLCGFLYLIIGQTFAVITFLYEMISMKKCSKCCK